MLYWGEWRWSSRRKANNLIAEELEMRNMSDQKATGSCLCGSVKYEITGNMGMFQYCHCSRCRKITGSAHAANLFVSPADFHWLAGEEVVERYEPAHTKYFATCFYTQGPFVIFKHKPVSTWKKCRVKTFFADHRPVFQGRGLRTHFDDRCIKALCQRDRVLSVLRLIILF